jgi:hypothetical protein
LIITPHGESEITVDNIKVAQFIYLLLNNQEIRDVIDTITSKAVLILGRFSEDRKPVLDAIREELRKSEHNYLPIVFEFQPLANQTTIETVKTLANMARFVIADLTDARSVLQELQAIVPDLPSLAVRLIIKRSAHPSPITKKGCRSFETAVCRLDDTWVLDRTSHASVYFVEAVAFAQQMGHRLLPSRDAGFCCRPGTVFFAEPT